MEKMDYKGLGKVLLVLSVLSILIAALDYLIDITLLGLGADSWMLVGIAFGVYAALVKQWK